MRFTLFFVVMPIAVVVWALLYLPFVRFTITSQGAGLVSSLVGQVFGGVIGVGNCVVSFAVSFLVANYGFTHKGRELMWYHILIVPCVLGSVVADIAVTMYVTLLEENRKYGDLIWDIPNKISKGFRVFSSSYFIAWFSMPTKFKEKNNIKVNLVEFFIQKKIKLQIIMLP